MQESHLRRKERQGSIVTGYIGNVRDKYHVEPEELGHGHYGVVRKCQNRKTGEWFAIKTIKKARINRIDSLRREIQILLTVTHPNIINLIDVYEDEKYLHLVTELCTGGELFDRIIAKTQSDEQHYSERDAAILVQKILRAINYCHEEFNVCHRDLKPENFLFQDRSENSELKIIDFGLSRFEEENEYMTTRVGTPYYIAPEVLQKSYDKACDLWSIGVITYILLCGYPPFYGNTDQEIFASVTRGVFDFPSPEWDSISSEAKDLICQLLRKNPNERPTASQALEHRWFSSVLSEKEVIDLQRTEIGHRMRRFMGMNKLKKVAINVIAQELTEEEIGSMKKVFESIDTDGNGTISVEELHSALASFQNLPSVDQEVIRLMQGVALDQNLQLDYETFIAATMARNIFIRDENIRRAFEFFDKEKTGQITIQNLIDVFGSEEHAREVLGDVDLNGDGVISYDEFEHLMKQKHSRILR